MNEALENFVDGLTDYGLTTLQFAVWAAARISRESINKAIDAMLIIFVIVWYQLTFDTQSTAPVLATIYFQFQAFAKTRSKTVSATVAYFIVFAYKTWFAEATATQITTVSA